MYHYDDDYDEPRDRIYERGCRCNSLSVEPCRFCQGDYKCPDGCGQMIDDCECCDGGCGQIESECMCDADD